MRLKVISIRKQLGHIFPPPHLAEGEIPYSTMEEQTVYLLVGDCERNLVRRH
jgi:hypothetical protein